MAKVITVTNQKGGVGKTTTTSSIAAGLTQKGFKVLCIDLDPQANLSFSVGAQIEGCANIYDVLRGDANAQYAVQSYQPFDIIPANIMLSDVEREFTQMGREFILKEALTFVRKKYDYIMIDTPPALSILTINAFTATDYIIIPMLADIFSLQGVGQLTETIARVKEYCNPDVIIGGIVLTKFKGGTLLSREIRGTAEMIAEKLNTHLFNTAIRESIAVIEAQASQESVLDYAPRNNVSYDYKLLVEEMLDRGI